MIKKVIKYLWYGRTIIRIEDIEDVKDEYIEKTETEKNNNHSKHKYKFSKKLHTYYRYWKSKGKKLWQKINHFLR